MGRDYYRWMYTPTMHGTEFMRFVKGLDGVQRIERLGRGIVESVLDIESSIKKVTCGLRMENSGINTCTSMKDVFVMFCDSRFPRPEKITMEMIDDRGVVVGHDIPPVMMPSYANRKDVIWLTDSFVLYPEKMAPYDVRMVMRASRLEWLQGIGTWSYYPSPGVAEFINKEYGNTDNKLSTILLGVDGLEHDSMPVADVMEVSGAGCGHGEPSSQNALYRCDLVGELLQLAQPALAYQDLHALVRIQVDVDGSIHQRLVCMLQVRYLIPHGCHSVVVDHHDGTDHPLVLVLPFVLGQRIADEIPYGFRSAYITFLGYLLVEELEKLRLQGDSYAGDPIHGCEIESHRLISST